MYKQLVLDLPVKRPKNNEEESIQSAFDSIFDVKKQLKLVELTSEPQSSNKQILTDHAGNKIRKICEDHEIEYTEPVEEILEKGLKEFYCRIIQKISSLIIEPKSLSVSSRPKDLIKKNKEIIHNQRRTSEAGSIKDYEILKLLNINKKKLKSVP